MKKASLVSDPADGLMGLVKGPCHSRVRITLFSVERRNNLLGYNALRRKVGKLDGG